MRKYDVGDRVVIAKDFDTERTYEGNGINLHTRNHVPVSKRRLNYISLGQTVTIKSVTYGSVSSKNPNFYTINEDGGRYPWSDSMFESCSPAAHVDILF